MSATWEIETQIIPSFINENKGFIYENMIFYSEKFFCNIFNAAFKLSLESGKLKNPIEYEPCEFFCSIESYSETEKLIYVELPLPRFSDFSYDMYVKAYFIPYRIKSNGIEMYDIFGVDTIKDKNSGLIIWYKDSQHLVCGLKLPVSVNDSKKLVEFMAEYIFNRI